MARKLLLTKFLIDQATKLSDAGLSDKAIYGMLRIGSTTYYRWLQEGEKAPPESLKRQFWESIAHARATFQQRLVDQVAQAATGASVEKDGVKVNVPGDWRAAAFLLERRFPADFGRRHQVDVQGVEGGAPIVVEMWRPAERKAEAKKAEEST
jgi:hypothetical protein